MWKYLNKGISTPIAIGIVLILVILVGSFTWWQYGEMWRETSELPGIELSEKEGLDYRDLLSQMFPEKEFIKLEEGKNCFKDQKEVFYCIDEVREGFFTNTEKKENLLVIREGYFFNDGKPSKAHVEGITHILLAVFDKESKEILSKLVYLVADSGEVAFYDCKNGTYILFYGGSGGQGWITGDTRLISLNEGKSNMIWPDKEVWDQLNTMVKPEKEKLIVYEREYVQSDFVCSTDCLFESIFSEGGVMPSYAFIYSYSMNWNSDTCKFEKDETADWLTFNSISVAESYSEEYKLKYPREWFYESEKDEETRILTTIFKIKSDKIKLEIQVLPDEKKTLMYNSNNFNISDIKIEKNNFQELRNKNNENVIYIYKLDYKDNLSDNYYIVFRLYDDSKQDKEILLTALGTLQFLGRDKKGAIIGADKDSWQKIFKSEEYGFQMKYQNGFKIIDNLDDLSLIFVDGMGMYSNINLVIARLSGVSTVEEWMDRELTINKNAPKKSDREYYRIGDSDQVGIMAEAANSDGVVESRAFYTSRGQYLYVIKAPLIGTNEFAYYRMVSNFEFLEPRFKLIGLRSKMGIENIFEFNESLGKFDWIPNEKDFYEKGYLWEDIKWYQVKIAGIIPEEIKSFFPATVISPQGLLSTNNWKKYQSKDSSFKFMYPKEWEKENFSSDDALFFNFSQSKIDAGIPMATINISRQLEPIELFKFAKNIQVLKFNDIESLLTFIYGDENDSDPDYAYNKGVNCYIEFHAGVHDYFLEMYFKTGDDYNKNMQIIYTILSSMRF